jgi:hypothetical protein
MLRVQRVAESGGQTPLTRRQPTGASCTARRPLPDLCGLSQRTPLRMAGTAAPSCGAGAPLVAAPPALALPVTRRPPSPLLPAPAAFRALPISPKMGVFHGGSTIYDRGPRSNNLGELPKKRQVGRAEQTRGLSSNHEH